MGYQRQRRIHLCCLQKSIRWRPLMKQEVKLTLDSDMPWCLPTLKCVLRRQHFSVFVCSHRRGPPDGLGRRRPCRGRKKNRGNKTFQKRGKIKREEKRRRSLFVWVRCSVRVRGEQRSEETRRNFNLDFNIKRGRHYARERTQGWHITPNTGLINTG